MKSLLMITATSLLLATSASAQGITFTLPNLWFPDDDTVTVAKDCLPSATTTALCDTSE